MSRAAPILKRSSYMFTRRTTRRFFILRPDKTKKSQDLFLYCLAVAAQRYGVEVHAVCVMSNHFHVVLSDPWGLLPSFKQMIVHQLANATKVLRGWPEEVFNKSNRTHVELGGTTGLVHEIAYTIANPVDCGAVRTPENWPGVITLVKDIGRRVIKVRRPDYYFDPKALDKDGNIKWPEEIELRILMPKALLDKHEGDLEAAQDEIQTELDKQLRAARKKHRENGTFIGNASRVMRQKLTRRGSAWETYGALNPRIATGGDKELAQHLLDRYRAFWAAYVLAPALPP